MRRSEGVTNREMTSKTKKVTIAQAVKWSIRIASTTSGCTNKMMRTYQHDNAINEDVENFYTMHVTQVRI